MQVREKNHKDTISVNGIHCTQVRQWSAEIAIKADFCYATVAKLLKKHLEVCTGRIDNDSGDRIVWDLPILNGGGYWIGYIQPDGRVIFNARS